MSFLDRFKKGDSKDYDTTNYKYALDFKKAFENLDGRSMEILSKWVEYDNCWDDSYVFLASTIIYGGARVHAGDTSFSVSKIKTLYQKGLDSKHHDEDLFNWYKSTAQMFVNKL